MVATYAQVIPKKKNRSPHREVAVHPAKVFYWPPLHNEPDNKRLLPSKYTLTGYPLDGFGGGSIFNG